MHIKNCKPQIPKAGLLAGALYIYIHVVRSEVSMKSEVVIVTSM